MATKNMDASTNDGKGPLMLEDVPSRSIDDIVHKLDMSNGSASISLGPLVVNEDGTLARISNWDKMTDGEQNTTMRVLTKRNAARLQKLRQLEAERKLLGQVQEKEQKPAGSQEQQGAERHNEL